MAYTDHSSLQRAFASLQHALAHALVIEQVCARIELEELEDHAHRRQLKEVHRRAMVRAILSWLKHEAVRGPSTIGCKSAIGHACVTSSAPTYIDIVCWKPLKTKVMTSVYWPNWAPPEPVSKIGNMLQGRCGRGAAPDSKIVQQD
eukprot:6214611-Pleurochrysis_carterae.AAC.2